MVAAGRDHCELLGQSEGRQERRAGLTRALGALFEKAALAMYCKAGMTIVTRSAAQAFARVVKEY